MKTTAPNSENLEVRSEKRDQDSSFSLPSSHFSLHPPALVPKLRFPEFREAEGWEPTSLGSVARLRNGYAFKSAEYVDAGPYRIITIANVQQGNLTIESTKQIAELPSDIQQHQVLSIGDILISMTGNVGRVCRVTAKGLLLNQRVGKLSPYEINAVFFYQLLQRDEFRNTMQLKAAGGAQGNLSGGDITEYAFSNPATHAEQQKIAECLSSVDELIVAQARKVDALKTHKKGLLQKLFPAVKGSGSENLEVRNEKTEPDSSFSIQNSNSSIPPLRFPEFQNAGEWSDAPMGTLLISSPDYGVNAAAVPFSERLPKYLRITDISEDGRYLPEKQVSVDLEATDGNYLDEGDIVLTRTGASVGKSYQYRKEDGRLVFAGFLIRVKPDPKKLVSTYLANFLTTGRF